MTHLVLAVTDMKTKLQHGFTLLETIIYMALFGLLLSGLLASMWPFLRGADMVSAKVVVESESAFAIRKINTILASSTAAITMPVSGNSGNVLTLTAYNGDTFTIATSGRAFTVQKNAGTAVPFTADRVDVTMFTVKQVAPANGFPRFIEYSFILGGVPYGPIRKYFIF